MQQTSDSQPAAVKGMQSPLMSPEEIAAGAGEQVPYIRYPEAADVFASREGRLRHLAAGHAMQDYLFFAADLVHEQHVALNSPQAAFTLPDQTAIVKAIDQAIDKSQALLEAISHERDPRWVEVLRNMLGNVAKRHAHRPAGDVIRTLLDKDDEEINRIADRLLHGYLSGLDLAHAQLIAVGLQVYFTSQVIAIQTAYGNLKNEPFGRIMGRTELCPCCGSRPVASITRIGAQESGLRYVSCSLCSSQWHLVRIKCVACENTNGIYYESVKSPDDGAAVGGLAKPDAVQVECCDSCGHFLKIVHMEKDQFVEPHADDLASVSLDLLAAEGGRVRFGNNLMLLFGSPPDAASGPDPGGA
jgi:FdhE protein